MSYAYGIDKTTIDNIHNAIREKRNINYSFSPFFMSDQINYIYTYNETPNYIFQYPIIKGGYLGSLINEEQKIELEKNGGLFSEIISIGGCPDVIGYHSVVNYYTNANNFTYIYNTSNLPIKIYGYEGYPVDLNNFEYIIRTDHNLAYRYNGFGNYYSEDPYCYDDTINMAYAFANTNCSSNFVCGNKVENFCGCYYSAKGDIVNFVCGDNVKDFSFTYAKCLGKGEPVCGPNVISMRSTYFNCSNLIGQPVCGPNVTDMVSTYYNCSNLTGTPVCGPNVINMFNTYYQCNNLTGQPICGDNVINMRFAYAGCSKLNGNVVCGKKVTDMSWAYSYCSNIKNAYVEENVIYLMNAFAMTNCINECYIKSKKVENIKCIFSGHYQAGINTIVHIYPNCNTNNTFYKYTNRLITSTSRGSLTWTLNTNCYYNSTYKIYIYFDMDKITIPF